MEQIKTEHIDALNQLRRQLEEERAEKASLLEINQQFADGWADAELRLQERDAAEQERIARQKLARDIAKAEGLKKDFYRKQSYFTQMEQTLKEVSLSDAEKALLLVLASRINLQGIVHAGKLILNQAGIAKLIGWSERYTRQILAGLMCKEIVIVKTAGTNNLYELNTKYFKKGKRAKKKPFIKLYNAKLQALVISTNARAFLFVAALFTEFGTNTIIINGKPASQNQLLHMIGWTWKPRLVEVLDELAGHGVIIRRQIGKQHVFEMNPEYIAVG